MSATQATDGVLDWLLEPDCQPVRYLTLTRLLGRRASDPEVRKAATEAAEYPPTRAILEQVDEFRDDDAKAAYAKYTGRYWQIIFLGLFHANGDDPRVRGLADRLIEARDWTLIPKGGHCLTANLLHALSLLGYDTHPAVREATVALAGRVLRDGGIACGVMDYSLLPMCYMAQPKLLLCFSHHRDLPGVAAAIDQISESLLSHAITRYVPGHRKEWLEVLARNPGKEKLGGRTVKSWVLRERERFLANRGPGPLSEKAGWLKLGFPLHYNSDLLEALYALAACGVPWDERLDGPLAVLRAHATPEGRYRLENSLNGKMRADVETLGEQSKWLTFRAAFVFRHFSSVTATPAPAPRRTAPRRTRR